MPDTTPTATSKKTIFSGIQPTGNLMLGNYLGALRNWAALQDEYDCIYCSVDMHALTIRPNPAELRRRSVELIALYIACGLDPKKNTFFIQSHVPAHAQLTWVLDCFSMFGELGRMTQFKDKSKKHADNVNVGLFNYPVLMAADILLYQADLVPVGEDQKQHMELTRDIAQRFNGLYGDVFTIPDSYIPPVGARIMDLQDPASKMSKSDETGAGVIYLLDKPDDILRKFKRAVTDSDTGSDCVRRAEDKAGVGNLMTIYAALSGKDDAGIEREFAGRGYGDFKSAVGEACVAALTPIQARFKKIVAEKSYLDGLLREGAARAGAIAERTLRKVYKKIGFYSIENGK